MVMKKPTKEDLRQAYGKPIADTLATNLKVIFCGINPGLYTAAMGYAYSHPGNRFWPTLYAAGFTPRLLAPVEQHLLLALGYGLTNLVPRATASEKEWSKEELVRDGEVLLQKLKIYQPDWVAFVGVGAYRKAFDRPEAEVGMQHEKFGETRIWLLPSPSGLNAHYAGEKMIREFRKLRELFSA